MQGRSRFGLRSTRAFRIVGRLFAILCALLLAAILALWMRYGGGGRLADLTSTPTFPSSVLEVVANLDYPPGNIAVSRSGRIFLTLHPDGQPPVQVVELVDGVPRAYPDASFQRGGSGTLRFRTPLSLRIDRQDRLWVIDHADYGRGQPRIVAFDLATDRLVHEYAFPAEVAGFLSMLNDLQVSPAGDRIYIAEASPIAQTPAIIVYDAVRRTSRRLLDRHPSVMPMDVVLRVGGRDMVLFGIVTLRIGVDSIALDPKGQWLYYGPVNGDRLYRIATRDLDDASLDARTLGSRVEDFAAKTASDGLTMDLEDNIYITDPEQSAVLSLGQNRQLRTLVKDPRVLRWPDGFSFGPDGWLYLTCSALQHVILTSAAHQRAHAPYQVYRFKPGPMGVPGH